MMFFSWLDLWEIVKIKSMWTWLSRCTHYRHIFLRLNSHLEFHPLQASFSGWNFSVHPPSSHTWVRRHLGCSPAWLGAHPCNRSVVLASCPVNSSPVWIPLWTIFCSVSYIILKIFRLGAGKYLFWIQIVDVVMESNDKLILWKGSSFLHCSVLISTCKLRLRHKVLLSLWICCMYFTIKQYLNIFYLRIFKKAWYLLSSNISLISLLSSSSPTP